MWFSDGTSKKRMLWWEVGGASVCVCVCWLRGWWYLSREAAALHLSCTDTCGIWLPVWSSKDFYNDAAALGCVCERVSVCVRVSRGAGWAGCRSFRGDGCKWRVVELIWGRGRGTRTVVFSVASPFKMKLPTLIAWCSALEKWHSLDPV